MIRIAIALCIIASPSIACDYGGSTATSRDVLGGIDVMLDNKLAPTNGVTTCVLPFETGAWVTWDHRPGTKPDEITITPPDGYIAIPDFVILNEGQSAVVQIREWSGM